MVWWCNMGTIGDKLTYLEEAKTAIKNAIIGTLVDFDRRTLIVY